MSNIISVVLFKDTNDRFVRGTIVLESSEITEYYRIDNNNGYTPVNCTGNVVPSFWSTKNSTNSNPLRLSGLYFTVPQNISTFDFGLTSTTKVGNISDLSNLSVGGVNAVVSDTVLSPISNPLPSTSDPEGSATLTTSTAGEGATQSIAIAYNYSNHFDRIVTALEQISENINIIRDAQERSYSTLEILANDIRSNSLYLGQMARILGQDSIPIKDVYAPLSYSSIVKLFKEQGIDIDSLISQTRDKLRGLE